MAQQYYDPWANAGKSANKALFQYLTTRPNANEVALGQAKVREMDASARKTDMEAKQLQAQAGAPEAMKSIVSEIYAAMDKERPAPDFMGPMGQVPVTQPVINQRYQDNLPGMIANAMDFTSGKPSDFADVMLQLSAFGGANPDQITTAQQGAGIDYAHTRDAVEAAQANDDMMGIAKANRDNSLGAKYQSEADLVQGQVDAPSKFAEIFSRITNNANDQQQPLTGPMPEGMVRPMVPPMEDLVGKGIQDEMPDIIANLIEATGGNLGDIPDTMQSIMGNFGTPKQLQRAQQGAGMDYGKTEEGFYADPSNTSLTVTPGSGLYNSDLQQVAQQPFKPEQHKDGFEIVTNPDGSSSISFGGSGISKSTINNGESSQVANANMRATLTSLRDVANRSDESSFGATGYIKGKLQDATGLYKNTLSTMGFDNADDAINSARQHMIKDNIDPSILDFDPKRTELDILSQLMVYQAAATLADQKGKGLSDNDVKHFKEIIGEPTSFFMNKDIFLTKLDVIENELGMREKVIDTTLGRNVTGSASGQPQVLSDDKQRRVDELRILRDEGRL